MLGYKSYRLIHSKKVTVNGMVVTMTEFECRKLHIIGFHKVQKAVRALQMQRALKTDFLSREAS